MKRLMTGRVGMAVWMAVAAAPLLTGSVSPPGFPPFAKGQFTAPALGAREPQMEIDYPGSARTHGITNGAATVAVLVGLDGKPLDFVVTSCTHEVFGSALLERARMLTYQPAAFQGAAVPARFDLGYRFEAPSSGVNVMEASRLQFSNIQSENENTAVPESRLDQPLEFTNAALPRVPASYTPPDAEPVRVFVTFYVDPEGRTHAPNVESAAAPVLFHGAVKAVRQWTFQPPTVNGKPATVFAGRAVGFLPRTPPPADEKKAE